MNDKCKKIMECLSDYLDGEMSEELCEMVEKHVKECEECMCFVDGLKTTVQCLQSLPADKIPENIEKSVLENLKKILFE